VPRGETLVCDVAIVGAGMAGITIADQLRASGKRICLIEGGGINPAVGAQRLLRGENVGRDYFDLDRCRFRVLGGSSVRWGGWCRPLEAEDFAQRDWLALSGWPIDHEALGPFYDRASDLLGLSNPRFDLDAWAGRVPAPTLQGGAELEPAIIQYSERLDFGQRARPWLRASDNVTALVHANVTDFRLVPGTTRVDRLTVTTNAETTFTVRAPIFVLAAGAIENARVLLAARADRSAGLGNESDYVGRCFMEHLHVSVGYIEPTGEARLDRFFTRGRYGDTEVRGVLKPTGAALRQRRTAACSISLDTVPYVMGPAPMLTWPTGITARSSGVARRASHDYPGAVSRASRIVTRSYNEVRRLDTLRRARQVLPGTPRSLLSLYVRGEQTPNRSSRITLSPARDRLGLPRARLDWQIADSDLAAISTWTGVIDGALRERGVGRVLEPKQDWRAEIVGGPHHLGTTRMSRRPADGVVDGNCRVHTVDNLYVAGSSVFTTGGHANPSLTILALAIRLADHLRSDIS
jgi:choline dehydrogenase-like flavoprotein